MAKEVGVTKEFRAAIDHACERLELVEDQVLRAKLANQLIKIAHDDALVLFGEQRTLAFESLRDDDWTLADLAAEFGISRARAAQVSVRERYKSGESTGGGGNPRKGSR